MINKIFELLPHMCFTYYSSAKLLTLLGEHTEKFNPLTTGTLDTLLEFCDKAPKVLLIIPSYNDTSIDSTLSKWFDQKYPEYKIIVAEDGTKSYEKFGKINRTERYEYTLPNGNKQEIMIEKIEINNKPNLDSILIFRRGNREGFKPGAINNVIYSIKSNILEDFGIRNPDYVMIIDADHEPGGNPFLKLILHKTPVNNLSESDYKTLQDLLKPYEVEGKYLLNLESYRLNPKTMDDPNTMITRAVEAFEYHKKFVPQLAVVQGYQNHYSFDKGLDLLVQSAHILAQWNIICRSPRIKIKIRDKSNRELIYISDEKRKNYIGRMYKILTRLLQNRWKPVNKFTENNKEYEIWISNHGFPLFTGSSGIIRWDLLSKYMFADGIFTHNKSITEDWELSIRLQKDGYYIFATHQLETWGRPPENISTYKKQQYRWAYGTVRDIITHFKEVMGSNNLQFSEKLGFIAQAITILVVLCSCYQRSLYLSP